MKALISPNEHVSYISAWTDEPKPQPIYSVIPNAQRVAEISENAFEVAPPLFWVDCANDVVADQFYYDSATAVIQKTPDPAPYPEPEQPVAKGAQTL
jgi:hypothetical protein